MSERSRAALLPTPGDPFLLTYWLDLYRERWASMIDHLYVYVNTSHPQFYHYISTMIEVMPDVTLIWSDHQVEHGTAIARLLEECAETYVMLIEDDAFIFKPNEVDRCFQAIEDGTFDLIGSKRGSASSWIINLANQRFGLQDIGEGDSGPNFWPNFLFTKKETLLRTDGDFGAKQWNPGDQLFGQPAPSESAGDTFVWASLQLRELGLKIGYVKQYHGAPEDIEHHSRGYNLFDGLCPWVHVGSLSSGLGGFLSDNELPDYANADYEKWELERRLSFWEMFYEHYVATRTDRYKSEIMTEIVTNYKAWIERTIAHYHLSRKSIDKRKAIYKELMSWT